MTGFIEKVWQTSDQIKNNRTPYDVMASVMEETGELALEVSIVMGGSYKEEGPDGIIGEAIDLMISTLDLVRIHYPDITEEDLVGLAHVKLLKWTRKVAQHQQALQKH